MLIGGIVLGLILGLLAGGSIGNLAAVRLRWIAILFLAVIVRFATETAIGAHIDVVQTLRLPLLSLSFGLLLAGLWVNRSNPGLGLAFVGILMNRADRRWTEQALAGINADIVHPPDANAAEVASWLRENRRAPA